MIGGIEFHDDGDGWFDMDCIDLVNVDGIVKANAYIEVDSSIRQERKNGIEIDCDDDIQKHVPGLIANSVANLFVKCSSVISEHDIDPLECWFSVRFDVDKWDIAVRAVMRTRR